MCGSDDERKDKAKMLYKKAANCYKLAKEFEKAANIYKKCAELEEEVSAASGIYIEASMCMKKVVMFV